MSLFCIPQLCSVTSKLHLLICHCPGTIISSWFPSLLLMPRGTLVRMDWTAFSDWSWRIIGLMSYHVSVCHVGFNYVFCFFSSFFSIGPNIPVAYEDSHTSKVAEVSDGFYNCWRTCWSGTFTTGPICCWSKISCTSHCVVPSWSWQQAPKRAAWCKMDLLGFFLL